MAIVGAGPYGLSVAAHALDAGLDAQVFGRPMQAWEQHMPRGMLLKSEPQASHLGDPDRRYGLDAYRQYSYGEPVPVETFVAYGKWFSAQTVKKALDESTVTTVGSEGGLFAVTLSSGDSVLARTVVLAVGFLPFAHKPAALAGLPPEVSSHASDHHDLSAFAGRDVTVVGAGQSALETATLLKEAGAMVRVVARCKTLAWNDTPVENRSMLDRMLAPSSGLGTGWPSWVWSELPGAVRYLPRAARKHIVRNTLGPCRVLVAEGAVRGGRPRDAGRETRGRRAPRHRAPAPARRGGRGQHDRDRARHRRDRLQGGPRQDRRPRPGPAPRDPQRGPDPTADEDLRKPDQRSLCGRTRFGRHFRTRHAFRARRRLRREKGDPRPTGTGA
ncbi:NAD(P)-binding domain-containing protein [Nonomuraea dietziae]|uniref:Uncharacterized protein n=1 Tax=Nonomuraea dietziae TaxID=65515 RepID=A0A7W5VEE6_9ACTN|nr:NAD(P)-binding domain-containing protein [Nonomuraea dietziae]MBB3730099.1 hypothetical protein [Nonomuraea dietziae]